MDPVGDNSKRHFRLSIAGGNEKEIKEGVKRLRAALEELD